MDQPLNGARVSKDWDCVLGLEQRALVTGDGRDAERTALNLPLQPVNQAY